MFDSLRMIRFCLFHTFHNANVQAIGGYSQKVRNISFDLPQNVYLDWLLSMM